MKKFFTFILILILASILPITAYATEKIEEEPIFYAEYSELEQLVQLRSMSENELSRLGFLSEQI